MTHDLDAPAAGDGAVRLVCIDVDGTLVGAGGAVHPRVWPAAEALRAAGVRVAVCTGRPGFGDALAYARRLDGDGWHIFQNGASVLHLGTGASRSALLAESTLAALLAQQAANGQTLEFYGDATYAVGAGARDEADRAVRHMGLLGAEASPLALADFARATPVVRAQWMIAHADTEAVLADPPAGARLVPSLSPVMPETRFVSVLAAGADKVVGVRAVAEAYGVPLSGVMFVGDGANDATAMAAVGAAGGVPVAMANGEAEALAVARHVVGDVDDGGLADAMALALARTLSGDPT
jgi:Cof subfamily protein (haloacid dehalogenase superfamily)